jgi:hypothetical protein
VGVTNQKKVKMDKRRRRLFICLILIFVLTTIAFLLSLFGKGGTAPGISGAAVTGSPGIGSPVWTIYLPGVAFLGIMIVTIWYLEKK